MRTATNSNLRADIREDYWRSCTQEIRRVSPTDWHSVFSWAKNKNIGK